MIGERERERKQNAFYDLVSEAVHHYFYIILFVRRKSVSPAHTQGEEIRLHLLKGEVSNDGCILKTTTLI